MYSCKLENIVKEIHEAFNVELVICELFERRWSYIIGTKDFISGSNRIKINDKYGIIIDCEDKDFNKIERFILKRKDWILIEKSCCD